MSGYRRPFITRLLSRRYPRLANAVLSTAAALLFSSMLVALLLTLGNTESPGPAVCGPDVSTSSFHHSPCTSTDNGDPSPLIVASGAGLDLQEGER